MTDETYKPGLEGIIATETALSYLDVDHEQIVIRGYDLIELANTVDYIKVAHLLMEGHLPTSSEYDAFVRTLNERQTVPDQIFSIMKSLGPQQHLMDSLRTALSALATFDSSLGRLDAQSTAEQSLTLLARMPVIVANSYHIKNHEAIVQPRADLGYAANFLAMITGSVPTPDEAQAFDQLLTVYSEHEMPNSTFTAIVIASTLSDMYGALVGAVASLKGTLHGGANEAVMHMLLEMKTPDQVAPQLLAKLARKERIMGFGHRVYMKKPDPRAMLMKESLKRLVAIKGHQDLYDMCVIGEEVMQREKGLYPNLDYYAAPVYYLLGVPIELYTPIFFAARTAGLVAHVREQYEHNRLFRPRVRYTGPRGLHP
ncbi:citrate synthase 3 [Sulfobacillus thermotolerans]|uniref:Citrate synthase n=1 Tax=Sulfobacillus thermotolerans TaxID=338644 RepID=A0ABM6RQ88_9FIRM|nr:citrate synthase 3 [Sulfobacillus thermotolerans]